MKINYRTLRRLTFSIYIIITVLFCFLLYTLGKKEIEKARSYTELEKEYFDNLIETRARLNSAESALTALLADAVHDRAVHFRENTLDLFREINALVLLENKRNEEREPGGSLKADANRLHSISSAAIADMKAEHFEHGELFAQNCAEAADTLDSLKAQIQFRLENELGHTEIWQRQSTFFFNRLQYLLVTFFILSTLFTVAASMLFGNILKSSIRKLTEGTQEISGGNLDYRFTQIQSDEIGKLMYDFNLMARRLQKQTEELQAANRELELQASELIDANAHKDRFLANMSHELRTPLNSIIGFSDLIAASGKSDTKTLSHAKRILSAAEHLLELITDLLEVARIDAGVLAPQSETFDVRECAENAVGMLRPLADGKKIDFSLEAPDVLEVLADRRMIRQTLLNLLGNALKFTAEGTVSLKLEHKGGKNLLIEVSDTGIGIDPENQRLIFRDFHRVETGLTSNYEGVGLGLTLTKRFIEMHGGTITLKSEMGKGSTFTVRMPVVKQQNERKDNENQASI